MLRKLFALTEQGAKDLKKGIIASVFTSLSLMMPMGLLLMLVMQLLQPLLGMETATPSLGAYAGMCLVLLVIICQFLSRCVCSPFRMDLRGLQYGADAVSARSHLPGRGRDCPLLSTSLQKY